MKINKGRNLKHPLGYYKEGVLFDVISQSNQIPWEFIICSHKSFFERMSRNKKVILKDNVSYLTRISGIKKYNFLKNIIIDITNDKKAVFYCDKCRKYNLISNSLYKDSGTCSICLEKELVYCANLESIFLKYDLKFKGLQKNNSSSFLILIKDNWKNFNCVFNILNKKKQLKEEEKLEEEKFKRKKIEKEKKEEEKLEEEKFKRKKIEKEKKEEEKLIDDLEALKNAYKPSSSSSIYWSAKKIHFSHSHSSSQSYSNASENDSNNPSNSYSQSWKGTKWLLLLIILSVITLTFYINKEDVDNKKIQVTRGIVLGKYYNFDKYIIIYKNINGDIFEVDNALKYWDLEQKDSIKISYFYESDSNGNKKLVFDNLKKIY